MSRPVTVLAFAGSLRRNSFNRALIAAVREEAPAGVAVNVWAGLGSIPSYNEDDAGDRTPQVVLDFRRLIGDADALLIATPEYNSSVPGVLKNALDWASRPHGLAEIVGKPAVVVGASSSSFGAAWAQAELRKVLAACGARVLDEGASFTKAPERLAADGSVNPGDAIRPELATLLGRLAEAAREPAPA